MYIFIWKHDFNANMFDNYHTGGGAVVIAPDLLVARTLLQDRKEVLPQGDLMTKEPDVMIPCRSFTPQVHLFPNKGCC